MQSNRVFIVDDEDFTCDMIGKSLKQFPVESERYKDGKECVTAYKANPVVKLILMDLNMPLLDGIEATKEIRAYEKSKGLAPVKIYGLSADDSAHSQSESKNAGMDGLLVKPINKAKLQTLLS